MLRRLALQRPSAAVLLAALLSACQGGGGCQSLGDGCTGGVSTEGLRIGGDYTFPREQALEAAAGVYLTDDGLSFLERNGLTLLAAALDLPTDHIDLSPFVESYLEENPVEIFDFRLRDVEASVTLPDGADSIDLTVLADPTRLRVHLSRLWVELRATVYDDVDTVTSACNIAPDAEVSGGDPQSLVFEDTTLDLILGVTEDGELHVTTDLVELGLVQDGISVVTDEGDPGYYCNLPECQDGCLECQLFCTGGDFLLDLASFFAVLFEDLVKDVVERFANQLLDSIKAVEGEVHPGLLLGSLLPETHDANWLGFRVAPGPAGFQAVPIPGVSRDLANDLFLSLSGGTESVAHECVPKIEGEPVWDPPDAYVLEAGATRPHLVLALADTFIDQLLWSAYRSGALCLGLGREALGSLSQTVSLNAGLVSLLLPGVEQVADADAPLLLTLQPFLAPDSFPVVELGAAQDGGAQVTVSLDSLDVGLWAWVQGRYLRLVDLGVRATVGMEVVVLPDNQLQLGIQSLDAQLLEERFNELFTGAELGDLIDFVLEVAAGVLSDGGVATTIDLDDFLSGILGLPVSISVDRLAAGGPEARWLELAVHLEQDTALPALRRAVETEIEILGDADEGQVHARIHAEGFSDAQLEYQVRWQDGAWSGFRPAGDVVLRSAWLRLPGDWQVEVRARATGDYRSLDMTPASGTVHARR